MKLMDFDCMFSITRCLLDANDSHILNNSRILPCGNKACLKCIEEKLFDKKFYCSFDDCKQVHVIDDVNRQTIKDKSTQLFYQSSARLFNTSMYERIKNKLKSSLGRSIFGPSPLNCFN